MVHSAPVMISHIVINDKEDEKCLDNLVKLFLLAYCDSCVCTNDAFINDLWSTKENDLSLLNIPAQVKLYDPAHMYCEGFIYCFLF